MNTTPKQQIANAIGMSFAETMETEAPELIEIVKKGELKSLNINTIQLDGKTQMKCTASDTNDKTFTFTFPLKPIFLQKIEKEMGEVFKDVRSDRKINMTDHPGALASIRF